MKAEFGGPRATSGKSADMSGREALVEKARKALALMEDARDALDYYSGGETLRVVVLELVPELSTG